jgi:hypothetical protein
MDNSTSDNKNNDKVDYETLIKGVPLAIGLFILCGSLYLTTYFSCFHINIFNYLDTTEILTTFLHLIQQIVFIISFIIGEALLIKFFIWIDLQLKNRKGNKESKETTQPKWLILLVQHASQIVITISLIFCIGYVIISYFIEIDSKYIIKNRDWMGVILTVFAFLASIWIVVQFEKGTKKSARNMIIFVCLFFISYSVTCAIDRIEATVNVPDSNTMIVSENDTIRTAPTYYYVGRTNKYIFFYDTEKERADVFPQATVTRMSFGFQKP